MKPSDIERNFTTGECILERGARPRVLYVVREGSVRLEPGGRLLGPGELFGELGAITGLPDDTRAVGETEGCVLAVDLALLQDLCLHNGEFALRLIRHLAARAAAAAGVSAGPTARVARAILALAPPDRQQAAVAGRLRQIAHEAGVDLLCAYREVQALLEERLVRLADDELRLLDREALASRTGTEESSAR